MILLQVLLAHPPAPLPERRERAPKRQPPVPDGLEGTTYALHITYTYVRWASSSLPSRMAFADRACAGG